MAFALAIELVLVAGWEWGDSSASLRFIFFFHTSPFLSIPTTTYFSIHTTYISSNYLRFTSVFSVFVTQEDEDFDSNALEESIAAAVDLQGASDNMVQSFTSKITAVVDASSDSAIRTFGADTTELYRDLVEQFEAAAEKAKVCNLPTSEIARIRRNNISEIKRALTLFYVQQVAALSKEEFALFKKAMSALRVTPSLSSDMDDTVKSAAKSFSAALSLLSPTVSAISPDSSHSSGSLRSFKSSLKIFSAERLLAARASGSYTPVPRKPLLVGLHWLLPKPFSDTVGDFRQADRQDPNNIIYTPKSKRSEVDKNDVEQGRDWRSKVAPPQVDSNLVYTP